LPMMELPRRDPGGNEEGIAFEGLDGKPFLPQDSHYQLKMLDHIAPVYSPISIGCGQPSPSSG